LPTVPVPASVLRRTGGCLQPVLLRGRAVVAPFHYHPFRALARQAGLTNKALAAQVRLSYAKVAEYQRRGVVHFHAVIRLDGPTGPATAPPAWATVGLLTAAIGQAVRIVSLVTLAAPGVVARTLTWGPGTRHPPDHHHRRLDRHQGRRLRREVRHQSS